MPAIFSGLSRIDHPDYNEQSVKEALLNATIHRDYNFNGSILFNIFDDRIEIMSLGGLVMGLDKDVIVRGVSELRNERLGQLFFRLRYVEAFGTGIPRMFTAYDKTGLKPIIEVFDKAFNVTLPNLNYAHAKQKQTSGALSKNENAIIEFLRINPTIVKTQAAEILGKKPDTAYRMLEKMVLQGYLTAQRNGKTVEYRLA